MLGQIRLVALDTMLAFIVLLTAACAQTPPTPAATAAVGSLPPPRPAITKDSSVLTVALAVTVGAVEFPFAPETNSQNAARTMYDSLLAQAPDGSIEPALATAWQVAADGKSYVFHLRSDVTFHNGEPFNADSVVFTWQTYRQKTVPFSAYFSPAQMVEKIDDHTVRIKTEEPNALLLSYIAVGWTQIPPGYYRQVGPQAFAERPVGTGPFMFEDWVKDDHLTLVANPNYWRKGYPLVKRVVFKFVPESGARVEGLKNGELDIAPRLGLEEAETLRGLSDVQVIHYPVDRVYYVAFNNVSGEKGPILDKRVRLAMNYAIDRKGIVKGLLGGSAQLASGFVGPADLGWDQAEPFPYNPARARGLLADAGYADGFAVEMACPNRAYSHINEVCEAVVRYLDKIGIRVHLQLIESNEFWQLEEKKQLPPLFADSWASVYREAYNRLQGALGEEASFAAWSDPKLQSLIEQVGHTIDQDRRAELYRQVQQMMRDDPPFIYLYYPDTFEGVSTRVTGYQPRASETYDLWNVGLNGVR